MGRKEKKKKKREKKETSEKENDAKMILLQLQHKEMHEAHRRQTKKRQIMYFPSDKVYVNGIQIWNIAQSYSLNRTESIFQTNS